MSDDARFFVKLLIGSALFIAIIVGVVLFFDRAQCRNQASAWDREWRWSPTTGCLIEDRGVFVPIENIRIIP